MHVNKLNKFILEIVIDSFDICALEIIIHFWNNEFLYDSEDEFKDVYYVYYNKDKEFKLYSFDVGEMYDNTLVIPEKYYLKPQHSIKHRFDSESDRYYYLKGLYNCLNAWGKNWNTFVRNGTTTSHNITMHDKFWNL